MTTADRVVTVTALPTVTATATATATSTQVATQTATVTATPTATRTVTVTATVQPTAGPEPTGDQYDTPGFHRINGRDWITTCEPYGATTRCWTWIWATQIHRIDGRYVEVQGWAFNNLTYLPLPKAAWGTNPLANTGTWTTSDGRQWRTECGTPLTGPNGCRTWATATVHYKTTTGYATGTRWVLNNMVRFA